MQPSRTLKDRAAGFGTVPKGLTEEEAVCRLLPLSHLSLVRCTPGMWLPSFQAEPLPPPGSCADRRAFIRMQGLPKSGGDRGSPVHAGEARRDGASRRLRSLVAAMGVTVACESWCCSVSKDLGQVGGCQAGLRTGKVETDAR